jgi:hypothetical protein
VQKAGTIRTNRELQVKQGNWQEDWNLMQMINWEKENKVVECNGKNNSSKLDKTLKDQWQWTYVSTAR